MDFVDLPQMLVWGLFSVSLIGICAIFGMSIASFFFKDFQFFPPPAKSSWQHVSFRALFRLFLYPLLALSVALFGDQPSSALITIAGVIMIFVGFGAAFRITFFMGWRNAFGEPTGLRTEGWFRHSRNPVYVATWIGLIGWGLVIPDPLIWVLLAFWGLLYLLAPLFEEPWLEREYGETYLAYKKSTPRFLAGF